MSHTPAPAEGWTGLSDGATVRWWQHGRTGPVVVLLHGGPGLPDYLVELAGMLADGATVYRYDQRGTGGSPWVGRHTPARHVADLAELLNSWCCPTATVVGHSYGTNLACRFVLAHPERVERLVLLAGPFLGNWRDDDRAERRRRMTAAQVRRHDELDRLTSRTEEEEVELLTLSWFPDHRPGPEAWTAAAAAARTRRPVAWAMNAELGAAGRADPLEDHLDALRAVLPDRTAMIGGSEDPRPSTALRRLADRLDVPLTLVERAGHEPWLDQPEEFRARLRDLVGLPPDGQARAVS